MSKPVSVRVLLCSLVTVLFLSVAISSKAEGPQGPEGKAGPQGPRGPRGPRGRTSGSTRTDHGDTAS